jgi:hypothetical protein
MAQHDYVIANGTGAAVRSDINNGLAAIVTNNSGASAPSTTYAYQWWADTSTNLLKLRNGANSSFITVGDLTAANLGLAALASPTFTGTVTIPTATISTGVGIPLGSAASPAIYFTGDTNTGIYSPGADQFAITTGGSGRVFVDSSGRVGLGTSSPSAALHVVTSGAGQIRYFDGTVTGAFGSFGSGNELFLGSGKALAFTTNGITSSETRMTIDTTGRVGIGTTSPRNTLDVNGTIYVAGGNQIQITGSGGATGLQLIGQDAAASLIGTMSAQALAFRTDSTERARIDSSGRLLVGTSSSSYAGLLTVSGNATSSTGHGILQLQRGSNATAAGNDLGAIWFGDGLGGNRATIEAMADAAGGAGDLPSRLVFSVTQDSSASPTERLRLENRGIVYGYSADAGYIQGLSNGSGTTYRFFAGRHTATGADGTGTETYRVFSNGNVQNTNGSYTTISDQKLKENIVDAGSQWNDLKAIRIRNWNFKSETGYETHRQIGPVAQEIEEVCPGLVFETLDQDDKGNDLGTTTKGVNQSVLYMKAVKALQEAMERIEQLETEMAEVKAQLQAS